MTDILVRSSAHDRADALIEELPRIRKRIDEMRLIATDIDDASLGAFRARLGLSDAADALDFALSGLISAFVKKK